MPSILMPTLLYEALIFQGEMSYWSLSGLTDKRWLAVDINPPLATNTEVKVIVLV